MSDNSDNPKVTMEINLTPDFLDSDIHTYEIPLYSGQPFAVVRFHTYHLREMFRKLNQDNAALKQKLEELEKVEESEEALIRTMREQFGNW